jgi:hypothetical protein
MRLHQIGREPAQEEEQDVLITSYKKSIY